MPRLDKENRVTDKFKELTKDQKCLYVIDGKETIEIDDVLYPKYVVDKDGLPLVYTDKAYKGFIESTMELIKERNVIATFITEGLTNGSLASSGVQYGKRVIPLNKNTISKIDKYVEKRITDSRRIYRSRGHLASRNVPKDIQLEVYGKEFCTFLRKNARSFGKIDGTPAREDTPADQLVLPVTAKAQKELMPYLFGYSKEYPGVTIVKNGSMIRIIHQYLNATKSKNASDGVNDYLSLTQGGVTYQVKNPSYKLPPSMVEGLAETLRVIKDKINDARGKGLDREVYSTKHFSSNHIMSMCKSGPKYTDTLDTSQALKALSEEERGAIKDSAFDEYDTLNGRLSTWDSDKKEQKKEDARNNPRKSTNRKSAKEARHELEEEDDRTYGGEFKSKRSSK